MSLPIRGWLCHPTELVQTTFSVGFVLSRIHIVSLLRLYLCIFCTFLNGFLLTWGSRGNLPFVGLVIFFTVAPNVFIPIHKSQDIPVVSPKAKECARKYELVHSNLHKQKKCMNWYTNWLLWQDERGHLLDESSPINKPIHAFLFV